MPENSVITALEDAASKVVGIRRPTGGPAAYVRNAWYVAAWSSEIGEQPLRRILLGEPIAMFRRLDGSVAAMTDRCPHRFAPLSIGDREGDTLQCAYHGLKFNSDGICVANPFGPIPKGATVRTWPIVERHGAAWLWAGAPDEADDSLIPDFTALQCVSGAPPIGGYMHAKANYEYLTDNLMDLSHIEFVHRGTFGADGLLFSGNHSLTQEGDTLFSDWSMPDVEMPGWAFWKFAPGTPADQWIRMRWEAPAAMRLEIGATRRGSPREDGHAVVQAHFITPETPDTAHYFWATTRFTPDASPESDAFLLERNIEAFAHQDKPLIEATYRNTDGDFWSQQPVFMGVDAGATTARRLLERKIAAEGNAEKAT